MNNKAFEKSDERISKFIPYDQFQELLLPKNVQDYVPENHVARAVSPIIDFIDISAIVMSYDYEGAPPYHPRMMLKVVIYAYMIVSGRWNMYEVGHGGRRKRVLRWIKN